MVKCMTERSVSDVMQNPCERERELGVVSFLLGVIVRMVLVQRVHEGQDVFLC